MYPLALNMGPDIGTHLAEWPVTQTVKLLLPYRLDDPADIRQHHDQLLARLYDACRTAGRELLEKSLPRTRQPVAADDIPVIMDQIYQQGIFQTGGSWNLLTGPVSGRLRRSGQCGMIPDAGDNCAGQTNAGRSAHGDVCGGQK